MLINNLNTCVISLTIAHSIPAGSSSKITEQHLKGTDIDSDNLRLRFTLTKDLSVGSLLLNTGRNKAQISVKGPVTSFTQDDISKGFSYIAHSLSYIIIHREFLCREALSHVVLHLMCQDMWNTFMKREKVEAASLSSSTWKIPRETESLTSLSSLAFWVSQEFILGRLKMHVQE